MCFIEHQAGYGRNLVSSISGRNEHKVYICYRCYHTYPGYGRYENMKITIDEHYIQIFENDEIVFTMHFDHMVLYGGTYRFYAGGNLTAMTAIMEEKYMPKDSIHHKDRKP